MLCTGKQIAQMYSTDEVRLTENTIRCWAKKGLKHIAGPKNTFLYKKEWVEEFIEDEATKQITEKKAENFVPTLKRNTIKRKRNSECKVY